MSVKPLKTDSAYQLERLFSRNSCKFVRRERHNVCPAAFHAPVAAVPHQLIFRISTSSVSSVGSYA